eukprot:COSAG02_NODE_1142_length_14267_cov_4.941700_4_plen_48_part_00
MTRLLKTHENLGRCPAATSFWEQSIFGQRDDTTPVENDFARAAFETF